MPNTFFADLVTLLVVLNPIAKLPIFLAMTAGLERPVRDRVALNATLISFGILLFFIVAGQVLLEALGVGLNSFRLAGALVLLLFALKMIFDTMPPPPPPGDDVSPLERAIFPLAMPSIAGPGSMLTVVVLTDNARFSIAEQAMTTLALALGLVMVFLTMRLATPLVHVLRRPGIAIISRVMGLILAALAVDGMVRAGGAIVRGW
ncbi:MAG: MarC family protein [Acetobacteraceae bacterium]|nr:MarC family protein [Acetobacteraceae bacterium]